MDYKIDAALYAIDLKIAETIKNNKTKDYAEFKEKVLKLKKEKELVYQNDEETINKVLTEYVKKD
ncbi:MAG: hypothetical protein IKP28_05105 [Clostridia bacterium]|nr:hypothetical protein [Clostridia bacterium]